MLIASKILFTIADFCAISGISRRTYYSWAESGKAPRAHLIGNSARIHRDDLEKFLDSFKSKPTQPETQH